MIILVKVHANPGYSLEREWALNKPSIFDLRYYRTIYYEGIFQGYWPLGMPVDEVLRFKDGREVKRNDPKLEIKFRLTAANLDDVLNAA
ncbi:MAG TPA: hypothetical protein VJI97_02090 [Candidatus Nanoarchaeia archaeon]|nr:hypothetical protein [Candidatus Nanoarchaeia archaeon]